MSRDATSRCMPSQSRFKPVSTRTLIENVAEEGQWSERQDPFLVRLLTGCLSMSQLAVSWVCSTESHTGPSLSNAIIITIFSQLLFYRFCLLGVVLRLSMFREGCAPQVAFSSLISFPACAVCLVGDEVGSVYHGKRPACRHEVCS